MSAAHADPIEAVETPFARARAHAARLEGIRARDDMIRKPHSELEVMLEGQSCEWARLMLEEYLRLRAQLERRTEVVGADGVTRDYARDSERHLETVLGRVPVQRLAYQSPGSADLHPMDAALNLPREMFSHGIRRMVAEGGGNPFVRGGRRGRGYVHRRLAREAAGRGAGDPCGARLRRVLRAARVDTS